MTVNIIAFGIDFIVKCKASLDQSFEAYPNIFHYFIAYYFENYSFINNRHLDIECFIG